MRPRVGSRLVKVCAGSAQAGPEAASAVAGCVRRSLADLTSACHKATGVSVSADGRSGPRGDPRCGSSRTVKRSTPARSNANSNRPPVRKNDSAPTSNSVSTKASAPMGQPSVTQGRANATTVGGHTRHAAACRRRTTGQKVPAVNVHGPESGSGSEREAWPQQRSNRLLTCRGGSRGVGTVNGRRCTPRRRGLAARVGRYLSPNADSTMRLIRDAASKSIVNRFFVTAHETRVAVSPNAKLPPAPPMANTVRSAPDAESARPSA